MAGGVQTGVAFDYVVALAVLIKALGLSRQGTTNWLMSIIYAFDERGGEIRDGTGRRIVVTPDMEDSIFGEDLSRAWCTNVKRFATRRPQRRPKEHLLLRLQMFDFAFRVVGTPVTTA